MTRLGKSLIQAAKQARGIAKAHTMENKLSIADKMAIALAKIALGGDDLTTEEMKEIANEALDWHEFEIDKEGKPVKK